MKQTSSFSSTSALCTATVVVAGLLCGCASSARFSVQAERHGGAPASTLSYRLTSDGGFSGMRASGTSSDPLLGYVRTALASRGMFEAPVGAAPAVEIDVAVGRDPARQKILAHVVPVYAEGPQPYTRSGESRRSGAASESMPRKVGEREVTQVVTVHPKYLRLTARAVRPEPSHGGEASPVVWSVLVTNEDESPDLAAYARLMVAAAMDWIGRSSDGPAEVVLSDRDRRVVLLAEATRRPAHVANGTSPVAAGRRDADG